MDSELKGPQVDVGESLSETALLGLSAVNFARFFGLAIAKEGLFPGFVLVPVAAAATDPKSDHSLEVDNEVTRAEALGEAALHLYKAFTTALGNMTSGTEEEVDEGPQLIIDDDGVPFYVRDENSEGPWYAVTSGRAIGIFDFHGDAMSSVSKHSNNHHKRFKVKADAVTYYKEAERMKAIQEENSARRRELFEGRNEIVLETEDEAASDESDFANDDNGRELDVYDDVSAREESIEL